MTAEILPAYSPTKELPPTAKKLLSGCAIIWQQAIQEKNNTQFGNNNLPPKSPRDDNNYRWNRDLPEKSDGFGLNKALLSLAIIVDGFVTKIFLNFCASQYPTKDKIGRAATNSLANIVFTTSLGLATFLFVSPNKHR